MNDYTGEKLCAVIMGAGASHDVHIPDSTQAPSESFRPPLAKDLFSAKFQGQRNRHRGAQHLGYELASRAMKGTLNLETQLRQYAYHDDPPTRQDFKYIPLYLRDVLVECSRQCYEHSGAHALLIQKLLADTGHRVRFLTLNYDDLLENSLKQYCRWKTNTLDDYVSQNQQAILVKLHGSIDWFAPIGDTDKLDRSRGWLAALKKMSIAERFPEFWKLNVEQINAADPSSPYDKKHVYPVLTAPLAGKGQQYIVCPKSHEEAAEKFLSVCDKYLIVGVSGLDDDLLGLLKENIKEGQLVHYVGKSDVEEATKRFQGKIPALCEVSGHPRKKTVFTGGYHQVRPAQGIPAFHTELTL